MRNLIGSIYILVALIMFFIIPIVDSICTAISIANSIGAANFVKFEGALLWLPMITLSIGLYIIFGRGIKK